MRYLSGANARAIKKYDFAATLPDISISGWCPDWGSLSAFLLLPSSLLESEERPQVVGEPALLRRNCMQKPISIHFEFERLRRYNNVYVKGLEEKGFDLASILCRFETIGSYR